MYPHRVGSKFILLDHEWEVTRINAANFEAFVPGKNIRQLNLPLVDSNSLDWTGKPTVFTNTQVEAVEQWAGNLEAKISRAALIEWMKSNLE